MESDYKKLAQAQSICDAASQLPKFILGMKDGGNPLDPALETNPKPTYEMMNRDTVITVADQVAKLPSIKSFTYISASDVFPFINPRYITTKREAETHLFRHYKFKTVVLRPGVMYNYQRPSVMPIVNLLQLTNAITNPFKDSIASLPGGKMLTTPPLRTDEVARAVIQSIENGEHGIFDVEGIGKLSRMAR
ncbi:hypothetical protein BDF20DRAFT_881572 [Mycotypha africana]|uniref:uncharacterized protein n=1 Tax=Mycotypha africana TaxID=64632 RepID=UPI00230069AE|nr:uncharacterized protein BDF20DRAFT_881572 [Mycotypha africana]KAI8973294.1 hypothetical protein BDF20DRAFT_881572 [Mycotypha africana]